LGKGVGEGGGRETENPGVAVQPKHWGGGAPAPPYRFDVVNTALLFVDKEYSIS